MPPRRPEPPLAQALALGLAHGPAELLPVSSSAHVTLLPWLAGRPLPGDPELRKAFEVALHSGTAAALVPLALRLRPRPWLVALATLPPALAGLALERPVERRLGTPRGIAAGLLAGAGAMAAADALGSRRRVRDDADGADALALGLAQAAALVPGLSRNGMTLAAARARGFARAEAQALSWEVALPTLAGAAALKAFRLARRGLPPRAAAPLAAGAAAAFASTLAARPLLRRGGPLLPFAVYRAALAALVLRRVRQNQAG